MKKVLIKKCLWSIAILALLLVGCSSESLTRRETSLWYKQPAADWNEALPVGNGRMGAMVFGNPWSETLQLNEESVWAGQPQDGNADAAAFLPQIQEKLLNGEIAEANALAEEHLKGDPLCIRSYQPFGDLHIEYMNKEAMICSDSVSDYERSLDLINGVNHTEFTADGIRYYRDVIASAPDDILAVRLSADRKGALSFRLTFTRECDAQVGTEGDNMLVINGQIVDHPKSSASAEGPHMKFAGRVKALHRGGTLTAGDKELNVEAADEVVLLVAMRTDYNLEKLNFDRSIDPAENCKADIAAVENLSWKKILKRHINDHSVMMKRVSLCLGDKTMEEVPTNERLARVKEGEEDPALAALYFQFGRYLLMGSSRRPGRLPANLQGIWSKDLSAPWNSDYHTNINIQMNYWPAEVANLSECVQPFSDWINAIRVPGRVTARKTFAASGWTVNHVSDPFGHTSISDAVSWGTFPIAGPWLALHLWEHYRFTGDMDYLEREAYPCMMEAAEFLLTFMVPDHNGWLVTAPSNSPENAYRLPDGKVFRLTYGATMDVEIAMELFQACIEASELLGVTKPEVDDIHEAIGKLPPIRISPRYGGIQEWIEDYEEVEPGHRHVSHLFGLYPGTTINIHTPELFAAARRTIERRRHYNEDPKTRQGSYTGWSRAWMINFYARLGDGVEAGANVQALLSKSTLNNLFDTHPPFQIDGNFGGCAGIAEMLLQSHAGELHLLPALPPSWKDGEVQGLRARGGFTIGMRWEGGRLKQATILPDQDVTIPVRYDDKIYNVECHRGATKKLSF